MAEESAGGSPKKMSTKDILASLRAAGATGATGATGAKGGAATAPAAPAAPAASEPVAETPAPSAAPAEAAPAAEPAKKPAPGGKPKSTADILASLRAAGAGGAASGGSGAAGATAAPKPAEPAAAPKPAAAGGAKPKSTADILAALRAAKGGAAPAASTTEESPAAAAPAAKTAAKAAAPAATNLSVQEMLAAVRTPAGSPPAVAEKKPEKAAVAAPLPPKPTPAAAKKGAPATEARRSVLWTFVLAPFALAWWMLTIATGAAVLGTARFMLPNVLTEPPRKFKIGPPSDYDLGTVATKWVAQYGVWIVHTDQYKAKNSIYALASVCTHLGCTPSWLEGEQKFKCPCHGSGFYITGINFEGPAPRPLERVGIRLAEDGMLEVDKSLKFQEEMGQWNDTNSFVSIA